LHVFDSTDGKQPTADLLQFTNGIFLGSTSSGGENGAGTLYSFGVGLGQFVDLDPTSGKAGTRVGIVGTDLTGATNVTFNGSPAKFIPKSKHLIIATVPGGATSGPVLVKFPGETISSKLPFIVLQ
jgi:hypothetical protein